MENVHVAVYALCFFFLVSINGLIFLHFHRPIIQESVSGRMHAPTPAHKDLKGAVDKERNPAAFPRRYGQQDSDVTPAWEEPSGWNHMSSPRHVYHDNPRLWMTISDRWFRSVLSSSFFILYSETMPVV